MSGLLIVIGIVWVLYKLISEACEQPYESGAVSSTRGSEGYKAWQRDSAQVTIGKMSAKEFDKNVRAGKYR